MTISQRLEEKIVGMRKQAQMNKLAQTWGYYAPAHDARSAQENHKNWQQNGYKGLYQGADEVLGAVNDWDAKATRALAKPVGIAYRNAMRPVAAATGALAGAVNGFREAGDWGDSWRDRLTGTWDGFVGGGANGWKAGPYAAAALNSGFADAYSTFLPGLVGWVGGENAAAKVQNWQDRAIPQLKGWRDMANEATLEEDKKIRNEVYGDDPTLFETDETGKHWKREQEFGQAVMKPYIAARDAKLSDIGGIEGLVNLRFKMDPAWRNRILYLKSIKDGAWPSNAREVFGNAELTSEPSRLQSYVAGREFDRMIKETIDGWTQREASRDPEFAKKYKRTLMAEDYARARAIERARILDRDGASEAWRSIASGFVAAPLWGKAFAPLEKGVAALSNARFGNNMRGIGGNIVRLAKKAPAVAMYAGMFGEPLVATGMDMYSSWLEDGEREQFSKELADEYKKLVEGYDNAYGHYRLQGGDYSHAGSKLKPLPGYETSQGKQPLTITVPGPL